MSSLSVLLIKEGNQWAAQCLEFDIAAQGKTLHAAMNAFTRAYVSEVAVCNELGVNIEESIPPAPQYYWNLYDSEAERIEPLRMSPVKASCMPPAYMIPKTELRVC